MMDYLAWAVLVLVYIFMAAPILGNMLSTSDPPYQESLILGLIITCVFFGYGGVLLVITWAITQVFG